MTTREHLQDLKKPLTGEQSSSLRERFAVNEKEYHLLTGDLYNPIRGERLGTRAVLEKYITSTDKVIGLLDGSIHKRSIEDLGNPEASREAPDVAIFLDKSARPVAWFADAFWEQFADDTVVKPEFEFLNIDRTNWFMKQGHRREESERYLGPEDFDIDAVSEEDIARIRAIFVEGDLDEEDWQTTVWEMPTRLDDKKILIIDEVKNQGGTLSIAQKLLKRAIPSAVVSGDYFWDTIRFKPNSSRDELQADTVPVWYDARSAWGRGIGDISRVYYDHLPSTPENLKLKLGWIALSAPHFDPATYELLTDKNAELLQQDIMQLAHDIHEGSVLRWPSSGRDRDNFEEIIASQGLTHQEAYQVHNTFKK